MQILRLRAVEERTGLSDTTIWRYERSGNFPKRRRLGPNAVGWVADEVDQWLKSRCIAGQSADNAITA